MADYATKTDLKSLETKLDMRFDELATLMSGFANDVNSKLVDHDARFDRIERRLGAVEGDLARLNDNYNSLLNTIDRFLARIDHYETEQIARDHEVQRLKAWIEQIAKKLDVQLI